MGTAMPPSEKPSCPAAMAFARCRLNQFTMDTMTVGNPARFEPSAIRANVK